MNFSVSRELFEVLSLAARWIFAFLALILALRALFALLAAGRDRRSTVKNLPGSGTVGELVVISGSPELQEETWLPVPREGVLGAVRTCDLVIPCPGIRKHHLDFSWQDGEGLLLRPRSGCEALVNGVKLDCRSDPHSAPLGHGAVLTIGSAVLRMMVFAALAPSADLPDAVQGPPQAVPEFIPGVPAPVLNSAVPAPPPGSVAPAPVPVPSVSPPQPVWFQPPSMPPVQNPAMSPQPSPPVQAPQQEPPVATSSPKPRRSDRWKEDWSE